MRKGFTLVELSIVLVIIGLLVGGILAAQSMVSTVALQAQVRQLQQYDIATTNFRAKYRSWPGDAATLPHQVGYTTGNGNGLINDHNGNTPPQVLLEEPSRFFHHLYVSGDLAEEHSAAYGIGKQAMPELKIAARRGMTVTMNSKGQLFYFLGIYEIIGTSMAFYQMSVKGVMPAQKAFELDAKLDDGKPGTGNVFAVSEYPQANGSSAESPQNLDTAPNLCTTGGVAYNLANPSETACRLQVRSDAQ